MDAEETEAPMVAVRSSLPLSSPGAPPGGTGMPEEGTGLVVPSAKGVMGRGGGEVNVTLHWCGEGSTLADQHPTSGQRWELEWRYQSNQQMPLPMPHTCCE